MEHAIRWAVEALVLSMLVCAAVAEARPSAWAIRGGRFYLNGERLLLKVAKPIRNFGKVAEVERLIADLPVLKAKNYNAIEINCYWHQFDMDGDGKPDVSLAPLRGLVDAIHGAGMFPCVSVETYGVGGGALPTGFWQKHPDAVAVNAQGRKVNDTEYGFGSIVPTLHSPDYRRAVDAYIRAITGAVDCSKVLWFETTVEPQYIGNQSIDYSDHARRAYTAWLKRNGLNGPAFPDVLPAPDAFIHHPTWNRFRAEALADWVSEDAASFRSVAGADAYVAMDYLETAGPEMPNRNGDSRIFLEHLRGISVVQVNWHWHLVTRSTNEVAYRNLREVMAKGGRDWAISEHMTLNGSDFRPEEVPALLRSTLKNGTGLGWEFVNVCASSADPFSLYRDDWSAKPLMAQVDDHWTEWVREALAGSKRP